jgi:hypothetical protein
MKYLLTFSFGIILCHSLSAQVGIGTTAPNASAQLEIAASNKGVLIPRVSKNNRPANPATGLMIYQIDNLPGFYYYAGTGWKRLYSVTEADTMVVNPNPGAAADPGPAAGATGTITGADGIVYTTVRLGDGSVWLQQNLGSSRVATAADDVQSYGDLYQWGRWTDGHEKRTPVFSRTITAAEPNPNNPDGLIKQWGSNVNPFYYGSTNQTWWWQYSAGNLTDSLLAATPSSATANNGCDPCRLLLGGTWRMPTYSDFNGIVSNAPVTGVAIINKASAFSSYLKLSLGGYRAKESTSLMSVGQSGYFWSSTANAPSFLGATVLSGSFQTGVFADQARVSNDSRGLGYAVRCKKD